MILGLIEEVFAPVTRQTTLRAFLTIASKKGMILKHVDIKTAYLNGIVKGELYMRQPPGFAEIGKEDLVCKLKRSIYALKQSGRCWNQVLHTVLLNHNFKQCDSDPCLYVRRDKQSTIFLLIYVDDILIGCTEESETYKVYQDLKKHFEITWLGPVKHFLGHEIRLEQGSYTIRLTNYIENIVDRFGMKDANPSKIPMDPGYVTNGESQSFPDITMYRSLVGALLYVAVNARPDIAASVGLLGRKVSSPAEADWTAAKRVLRYLKGTKDLKLHFGHENDWRLIGYSDSDWGDQSSGRSTTGYVFFYGGGPIAWMSKRQTCVFLSSMEAEYNALAIMCQETMWLRRLFADLDEPLSEPTIINEDNQSCLGFVKVERASGRVKHIDTKGHFIRELCDKNEVNYNIVRRRRCWLMP